MDQNIKSEKNWSEELDHLPLKQRLKKLRASNLLSRVHNTKVEQQVTDLVVAAVDVVKNENQECVLQDVDSAYLLVEGKRERFPLEECQYGRTRKCCIPKIEQDTCCSSNHVVASELKVGVGRAEAGRDNLLNSTVNCVDDGCSADVKAINSNSEIPAYILDDLDHVDLKERRRMLLSRKPLDLTKPVSKDNIIGSAATVAGCLHDAVTDKEDSCSVIEYSSKGHSGSATVPPLTYAHQSSRNTTRSEYIISTHTKDQCSSVITSQGHELCGVKDVLSGKHNTVLNTPLATSMNVKLEPLENNELDKNILENSLMANLVAVKSEPITSDAFSEDELDHMLLSARIKLLTSGQIAKADIYSKNSRKTVISSLDCQPILSKSDPPARIKPSRKRKRTATDSVETALEEDAPGLLQVLVDKGVLIDEMKLYGQTDIDEAIDESLTEFSDLEAVISKLFSQRQSLLKLATLKGTKGEKTSYCLACLISLVEQARYLQFRKWPVEWGWCRDLQSFIFVFERHNRIVLERPEYGYATYFFELVDSLTVDWQIKRLVTTMKLTSCSRTALIENKALKVGEELTEGEAGVLADYGWIPDTGLGTMLNYRDRVVHDRKNEAADSSEWRSKIGNLLMDGFNGGTIISTSLPKKFADNSIVHNSLIKLEI
ncbi:High-affinity branched-chain amino acid transport system permease protein like [Heracleum sosnowskyi]|uniref:High-affinity branched-chain amino acid transport system permease protein like n=1 Tax=Heracleum sosnowskyi TaxID=360622 RepID=A0AAD8M6U5_9APIA|nr:High-affinity branched-chain amino acid transport system permease protein like [Heracleum sosnowskyi]